MDCSRACRGLTRWIRDRRSFATDPTTVVGFRYHLGDFRRCAAWDGRVDILGFSLSQLLGNEVGKATL